MLLSVIVPSYNSETTLGPCLKSIRSSTYADYELIVVDDASADKSFAIAALYADRIIKQTPHRERVAARYAGSMAAKGEIIVSVDSDVLIKPDSLSIINQYFLHHPEVAAVTGFLSKEHPNRDFFSQYKNLYMNYIFNQLPERVDFLYGSIYAIRRSCSPALKGINTNIAEDTAFGQELTRLGSKISLLKNLEVVHLKKYNLLKFMINDFQIPFMWAGIFINYQGWKQLRKNRTGFAHSSMRQIASVMLVSIIIIVTALNAFGLPMQHVVGGMAALWFFLNIDFIVFLTKERGLAFGVTSAIVTFVDNAIMALGIFCGSLAAIFRRNK